jgi:hypothetical protein
MAPRAGGLTRLLKAQAKDVGKVEDGQLGKVRELYRGFRLDLFDRLDFLDEQSSLTAARFGRAATQVETALSSYRKDFIRQLRGGIKPLADLSKRHLIEQFERFAGWFPGTIKAFRPPVGEAADEAAQVLIPQFEGSVGVYAEKISNDLRQRLAVSLQAGEQGQDAGQRVRRYLEPIRENRDEPVVAYWARKIVTDQTTRTRGTVKLELIAAGQSPKLQKRWCSTLDERTSDICEEMDGVVVDMDEPFTLPNGEQVMSPPGHPNCRADVIPWTEDWAAAANDEPAPEVAAEPEPEPEKVPPVPAIAESVKPPAALSENAKAFATTLRQTAEKEEPPVTAALKSLEGDDAKLIGLDFRLKSEGSLHRKIVEDAIYKPDQSLAEVAAGIKDSLRYTYQLEPERYAAAVPEKLHALEEQGFLVTKFKNFWGPDTAYQGINVNVRTPGGAVFELQFHTADSFVMKDKVNHPLYEEHRLSSTPPERRAALWQKMIDNQAAMPVPPGAAEVQFTSKGAR